MIKNMNNWIRQSRYRAKKHGCHNDIDMNKAQERLTNEKCAFCNGVAECLDNAFLLSDGAPNVLANILALCSKCKATKNGADLFKSHQNGLIGDDVLVRIIKELFAVDGGQALKEYVKVVTGIGSQ